MSAFVLMGVSGSGKSTISSRVATCLAWPYIEADALHPAANIEKMSQGIPLSDADRAPWIDALAHVINHQDAPDVIIACSALTHAVRRRLQNAVQRPIDFIHLRASPATLLHRLQTRRHFFSSDLLPSQLEALEVPPEAFEINADDAIDVVVARVEAQLRMVAAARRTS